MRSAIAITAAASAVLLSAIALASTWHPFVRYGFTDLWLAQGIFVYDTISPADRPTGSGRIPKQLHYQKSLWRPVILGRGAYWFVAVPLWPLALGSAVIAVSTYRRVPANTCRHCRYNLSGLPPSSPCPECGSPRSS